MANSAPSRRPRTLALPAWLAAVEVDGEQRALAPASNGRRDDRFVAHERLELKAPAFGKTPDVLAGGDVECVDGFLAAGDQEHAADLGHAELAATSRGKAPAGLSSSDVDRDEPVAAFRDHRDRRNVAASGHQTYGWAADARGDVGRAVGLAIFHVAELDLAIGGEADQNRPGHQGSRRLARTRPQHLAVVARHGDDMGLGRDHQAIAAHEHRVRVETFEANAPAFVELQRGEPAGRRGLFRFAAVVDAQAVGVEIDEAVGASARPDFTSERPDLLAEGADAKVSALAPVRADQASE